MDTYFYDVNKAWKFSCFNSLTTHLAEKVIVHQTSETNVLITSWICHYTIYYIHFSEYQVTCVASTASTLYDTLTDGDATSGSTSFKVTFNSGVIPGTTYECSTKMVESGFTSAKSIPSIVITPDDTCKYRKCHGLGIYYIESTTRGEFSCLYSWLKEIHTFITSNLLCLYSLCYVSIFSGTLIIHVCLGFTGYKLCG